MQLLITETVVFNIKTRSMKKHTFFSFLFFAIITLSFQKPVTIEGKWFVSKFENIDRQTTESSEKWIELLNDGTLRGGKKGQEKIKTGFWKYDSKKRLLTLESGKKYGDEGTYMVKELTEEKMTLLKDDSKIFFVRKKH